MLSPRDRTLLLESLRPPEGYRLDRAVGTSYTLDLLSLLTAPLAFTFYDWEDEEGRPSAEPLALLESVRRHADRFHLFCQAGAIQIPTTGRKLLAWLEGSVVEVAAPHPKGLFHPKLWVVRYEPTDPDEPIAYRLLCLSRNLTFDRSWDTALVLDGTLKDRRRAIAVNRPLSEFLSALPGMAVRDVSRSCAESIERVSDEVLRVDWEIPEPFDDYAFWPLGHAEGAEDPFPDPVWNHLVVSPFVDDGFLEGLAERSERTGALVSRAESLEALKPGAFENLEALHTLAPEADPEQDEDDGGSPGERLCGLHAKLFVLDDGWDASVYTGSANATTAAFERNVEFLVELRGKKSRCGVETFLADSKAKRPGFGDLLVPWTARTVERDPEEARREALQAKVDGYARKLAACDLRLVLEPADAEDAWHVRLLRRGKLPRIPVEAELTCWPSSLPDHHACPFSRSGEEAARFDTIAFESLTTFIAFRIALTDDGLTAEARFVLNLPAEGFPEDRRERLLRSLLRDRDQVLRLLWLLLSSDQVSVEHVVDAARGEGRGRWGSTTEGIPLLEALLTALDRDPRRLDDVQRLIEDLARTDEGRALLPEGFEALWEPVRRVREALVR